MTPEIYKSMKDTLVDGSYIFFEGCSSEHDYIYRFFKYKTKTIINGDLFLSKHYDEMATGENRHAAYVFITFVKINETEQITIDEVFNNNHEKLHWFQFVYSTGRTYSVNTAGLQSKNITNNNIIENRAAYKIKKSFVLIGIYYLGHMTKEEFKG